MAASQPLSSIAEPVKRWSVRRRSSLPWFDRGLYGHITHTDLASNDPLATKEWCCKVLGWTFTISMPAAGGEMHMFAYSSQGGGGIRPVNPPEAPGTW